MRSLNIILPFLFALLTTTYAASASTSDDNLPHFTLDTRKDHGNSTGNGNSLKKQCKTLNKLTKLTEMAANQTRLDDLVASGKLTTEEVTKLQDKAANATAELQSMQSNTTLVGECAVVNAHSKDVKACKKMNKLEKLSKMEGNDTSIQAYAAKKDLNTTEIDELKEKIANATSKLQDMMGNTTLVDFCTQRQAEKGDGDSATSTGSSLPAQSTGGAERILTQTVPLIAGVAAVFAVFL